MSISSRDNAVPNRGICIMSTDLRSWRAIIKFRLLVNWQVWARQLVCHRAKDGSTHILNISYCFWISVSLCCSLRLAGIRVARSFSCLANAGDYRQVFSLYLYMKQQVKKYIYFWALKYARSLRRCAFTIFDLGLFNLFAGQIYCVQKTARQAAKFGFMDLDWYVIDTREELAAFDSQNFWWALDSTQSDARLKLKLINCCNTLLWTLQVRQVDFAVRCLVFLQRKYNATAAVTAAPSWLWDNHLVASWQELHCNKPVKKKRNVWIKNWEELRRIKKKLIRGKYKGELTMRQFPPYMMGMIALATFSLHNYVIA